MIFIFATLVPTRPSWAKEEKSANGVNKRISKDSFTLGIEESYETNPCINNISPNKQLNSEIASFDQENLDTN